MPIEAESRAMLAATPNDLWLKAVVASIEGCRRAFDAWRERRDTVVRFPFFNHGEQILRVENGAIVEDGTCYLTRPNVPHSSDLVLVTGERIPKRWPPWAIRATLEDLLAEAGIPWVRVWRPFGTSCAYGPEELWAAAKCMIELEAFRAEGRSLVDMLLTAVVNQEPGTLERSLAGHLLHVDARGIMLTSEPILAWVAREGRALLSDKRYRVPMRRLLRDRLPEGLDSRGIPCVPVTPNPPDYLIARHPCDAMRMEWEATRPVLGLA